MADAFPTVPENAASEIDAALCTDQHGPPVLPETTANTDAPVASSSAVHRTAPFAVMAPDAVSALHPQADQVRQLAAE